MVKSPRRSTRRITRRSSPRNTRRNTRRNTSRNTSTNTRRNTRRNKTRKKTKNTRRNSISKEKNVFIKKKGDKKDLRIFVINLKRNSDRWKKYEKYNKNVPSNQYVKYEKFNAVDGNYLRENPVTKEDKKDIDFFKKIIMMWNAGDKQKGNVVGCLLSHIRLMRKIVSGKLNKVLVIEDDALVDMDQLKKTNLNKLSNDKMIYFGGVLRPLKFKDPKWNYKKVKKQFKRNTTNKIKTSQFKIGSTHGLYYPNTKAAKELLHFFESKDRLRAIDSELAIIQKKHPELLDDFFYPAIVYLVIEEAQKGFSGQYFKKDGFDRSMKEY